jgi:cell division protein FtsB
MLSGRDNPVLRAAVAAYRVRRRLGTGLAIVLAFVFGWHAIFGQNGVTAYAAKRGEDKALRQQIETLQGENSKLEDHVQHLQTDPDTIEMEARQRLHYTRAGEVIYTLNEKPKVQTAAPAGR